MHRNAKRCARKAKADTEKIKATIALSSPFISSSGASFPSLDMGLISILLVASMPVLKVLTISALGAFLATPHIGIFPSDARKHLNTLVFTVFTPSLIFCNLAKAVSLSNIMTWWFLPINVIISFLIGGILGVIIVKIFKPEPSHERLTIACCSAGNVGNLPLVLIPAICSEPNSPFKQPKECITNGMAYVSFSMAIAAFVYWTILYEMLKPDSSGSQKSRDDVLIIASSHDCKNDNEIEELVLINAATNGNTAESIMLARSFFKDCWCSRRKIIYLCTKIPFSNIMNPPVMAVIMALFIGGSPMLKQALIGESASLWFIQDSLASLGGAMLPSMILLLGGNLLEGISSTKIKGKVVAGIVVTKILILPIFGVCLVLGASHLGMLPKDPMFHFVVLLQYTMPTALSIGTITHLFGVGDETSIILFWCYLPSIVTITLWTMVYIWLIF